MTLDWASAGVATLARSRATLVTLAAPVNGSSFDDLREGCVMRLGVLLVVEENSTPRRRASTVAASPVLLGTRSRHVSNREGARRRGALMSSASSGMGRMG